MALHCPSGTAAKHYFAGSGLAVQFFLISSFLIVSNGEPLLLVSSSLCAPAPLLGVCARAPEGKALNFDEIVKKLLTWRKVGEGVRGGRCTER